MNSLVRRRPAWLVFTALLVAALACNPPGVQSPDTAATVNAISTSVQQTLAAQTTRASATNLPSSPTAPAPPDPTTAPALTQPSPTSASTPTPAGHLTRPNGPTTHAVRLAAPPIIDGNPGDWSGAPGSIETVVHNAPNWTGTADQSATFTLGWDGASLYLAIHVADDVHVQTQTGELIFKGDSLEILLDTNLAGDFADDQLSGDDYQLGLSPGTSSSGPDTYLWFPTARKGRPTGVSIAVQLDDAGNGFNLEAAIPWTVFNVVPTGSSHYGFALSVSDNDAPDTAEQQSMISTAPQRQLTNPTTWGTLVLDE